MTINADVSDSVATNNPQYRRGELHITGLAFLAIDVPGSISEAKALSIDGGSGQPSTLPIDVPPLPDGCFLHWFFVNEWSGFIRVAARDAEWRWADESDLSSQPQSP